MRESLRRHGQLSPLVVREFPQTGEYEILDGHLRREAARTLNLPRMEVLNLGPITDVEAAEAFLAIHAVWGRRNHPNYLRVFQKLASLVDADKLLAALPGKLGKSSGASHAPGPWIDFKFRVDNQAATVCDTALTAVQKSTGCKRSVAFERICADFLAGANPGSQP